MDKRYQVFISSTFTDLQTERAKVQKTIMQLDCIPAGMELFPAIDEEQLEFIKRIIDDSDYYLLIIGGRYGTMAKDGISYTEKEYDYAISKGIKVIALLHKNPNSLPFDKSEQEPSVRKKLQKFRDKASNGRVVAFWNHEDELPAQVALSLPVTIKTYPAVGWVRASSVPGPEIYKELNDLRKENDELRKTLSKHSLLSESLNLANLNDNFIVVGTVRTDVGFQDYRYSEWKASATWGEIFSLLAPKLIRHVSEDAISSVLSEYFVERLPDKKERGVYYLTPSTSDAIRVQLRALDLISMQRTGNQLILSLTSAGERAFLIENAIRKPLDKK